MTRLRLCEGCARHVFVTETRCPFCDAALAPVSRPPIYDVRAGMSRAQRLTLVAAVAGQTLFGCSDDAKSGSQGGTGGMQQGAGGQSTGSGGQAGGLQPVYGAPVDPGMTGTGTGGTGAGGSGTGGSGSSSGTGGEQGMVTPVYGAPIEPPDAGADAGDGGDDAGKDGGFTVLPPYGIPPR